MSSNLIQLNYTKDRGLRLDWSPSSGVSQKDIAVRVVVKGDGVFSVWGVVDSGESTPQWAERDLILTLFGPDSGEVLCQSYSCAGDDSLYATATLTTNRAQADIVLTAKGSSLSASLTIGCPVGGDGNLRPPALPVCSVELLFDELPSTDGLQFMSAHAYGGRTHTAGNVANITRSGMPFVHGCIGLGLPLVYVSDPKSRQGIQFNFLSEGRPIAWLRPSTTLDRYQFAIAWQMDRLLRPGEHHAFGEVVRINSFKGDPVQQMRNWRDAASAAYGLVSPKTPDWARDCNIIEFNMNPEAGHGFTRLDDPKCKAMLTRWKTMGYDAIFAVSPNHVGQNWLSPLDYDPSDEVGGPAAEKQALDWAHELGFKIFLWVTTVGIDRDAPEVKEHPDWFTQRSNGSPFYAWDSHPPDYIGYAPDGDPASSGWRAWLKNQVTRVIGRGYDGIFVDGCIPRASNHARWAWPGEARNGVEEQVSDLADHVRSLGADLITFVEDEGLTLQASCEMTMGRYTAAAPFEMKAFWDNGMGGGPMPDMTAPSHIDASKARDYFLIRYASLLPDAVTNDVLEGYVSDSGRPWTIESLISGSVPKTHSEYVETPEVYRPLIADADPPSEREKLAEHRLAGHEEFIRVLKLRQSEPLLRMAPLSIEAVRISGDDAVVGFLRPSQDRAILALIQFADRPSTVGVTLAPTIDVPETQRSITGTPAARRWRVKEIMHSVSESTACADADLGPDMPLVADMGPYGFRIFELT